MTAKLTVKCLSISFFYVMSWDEVCVLSFFFFYFWLHDDRNAFNTDWSVWTAATQLKVYILIVFREVGSFLLAYGSYYITWI